MTTKERVAMQQALNALEKAERQLGYNNIVPHSCYKDAITAMREALAEQAEQEPVGTAGELFTMSALERLDVRPSTKVYLDAAPVQQAEQEPDDLDWITPEAVFEAKLKLHGIPNPPVQQVDLTDDEIWADVYDAEKHWCGFDDFNVIEFARAVIAAYKEKNK